MVSRQVGLRDTTGLDFKMIDSKKGQWTISKRAEDCIVKHMAMRYSLLNGKVSMSPGNSTVYTFTFQPASLKSQPQVYTLSAIGGDMYIEIDPTHLEGSLLPSEDRDPDVAGEARLDKFEQAIKACKRASFGSLAPRGPAAAGAPADRWEMVLPPAPAAAGAPRPGFLEPRPAPPKPDYGDLEEMMRRMGVREGGRKKTHKLRRSKKVRRGRSKKNRFT